MPLNDFEIVNPISEKNWNETVLESVGATVFHSREWAQVLSQTYGYEPLYVCRREQGRFRLLIPVMEVASRLTGRRGVSLPFTDFCDPLFEDLGELRAAVEEVLRLGRGRGWRRVELRSGEVLSGDAKPSSVYVGHNLDLRATEEELFSRLKGPVRTALRKAEKSGVEVDTSNSPEAVRSFYGLNCITRREHGLPPQPWRFFENLRQWILENNKGVIVNAVSGGRAVAGAVFLHFGEAAVFKYGASDPRYQALRPGNMVMWHGIRWYREIGLRAVSLGRTRRENEGLLRFKRGWGVQETQLNYFTYDLRRDRLTEDKDHIEGFHNAVFRRLPLPCLRLVGALTYKHMG